MLDPVTAPLVILSNTKLISLPIAKGCAYKRFAHSFACLT